MKLRQLECFLAVVECGSFTRAAAKLGLAQPTLSQQIGQLEKDLAVPLFDRIGRSFVTTAYGKVLEGRARLILNAVDQTRSELSEIDDLLAGELRLGSIRTLYNGFVVPLCCKFRNLYPELAISIVEHTGDVIEELVCAGDLDIGFSVSPVVSSEIHEDALIDERLVLIVGKNHELAGREQVSVPDIVRYPMAGFSLGMKTRAGIDKLFHEVKLAGSLSVEMDGTEGLLQIVASTNLCAIVPELAVPEGRHDIEVLRLNHTSAFRTICMIRNSQRFYSRAMSTFSDFVLENTMQSKTG